MTFEMPKKKAKPEEPSFSLSVVENHRQNVMNCQMIIQRLQWMNENGLGDAAENSKQLFAAEKLKSLMLGGDGVVGDMSQ